MLISTAFPSRYLKASDLNGQTATVTIGSVIMETVGQNGDQRPVAYFRGHDKGMVLNKTNAKKIASRYGNDTEQWKGAEISLYEAEVDFQGETVPSLRVRIPGTATLRNDKQLGDWNDKKPTEINKLNVNSTPEAKWVQREEGQPPWEGPAASVITEAEGVARGGIEKFRDWRDRLNVEEYDQLRPDLERITLLAKAASAKEQNG